MIIMMRRLRDMIKVIKLPVTQKGEEDRIMDNRTRKIMKITKIQEGRADLIENMGTMGVDKIINTIKKGSLNSNINWFRKAQSTKHQSNKLSRTQSIKMISQLWVHYRIE